MNKNLNKRHSSDQQYNSSAPASPASIEHRRVVKRQKRQVSDDSHLLGTTTAGTSMELD
jgi:hypothetical protein|tara:strand:+ start:397 stop:573 length:177 start_codon:yes stop_codon:yes gene_type:complete